MRVRIRWAERTIGHITDIPASSAPREWFRVALATQTLTVASGKPGDHDHYAGAPALPAPASLEEAVTCAAAEGRLLGQRCRVPKVYIPPRGACPPTGAHREEVELPDTGTSPTSCIVIVAFAQHSASQSSVSAT